MDLFLKMSMEKTTWQDKQFKCNFSLVDYNDVLTKIPTKYPEYCKNDEYRLEDVLKYCKFVNITLQGTFNMQEILQKICKIKITTPYFTDSYSTHQGMIAFQNSNKTETNNEIFNFCEELKLLKIVYYIGPYFFSRKDIYEQLSDEEQIKFNKIDEKEIVLTGWLGDFQIKNLAKFGLSDLDLYLKIMDKLFLMNIEIA